MAGTVIGALTSAGGAASAGAAGMMGGPIGVAGAVAGSALTGAVTGALVDNAVNRRREVGPAYEEGEASAKLTPRGRDYDVVVPHDPQDEGDTVDQPPKFQEKGNHREDRQTSSSSSLPLIDDLVGVYPDAPASSSPSYEGEAADPSVSEDVGGDEQKRRTGRTSPEPKGEGEGEVVVAGMKSTSSLSPPSSRDKKKKTKSRPSQHDHTEGVGQPDTAAARGGRVGVVTAQDGSLVRGSTAVLRASQVYAQDEETDNARPKKIGGEDDDEGKPPKKTATKKKMVMKKKSTTATTLPVSRQSTAVEYRRPPLRGRDGADDVNQAYMSQERKGSSMIGIKDKAVNQKSHLAGGPSSSAVSTPSLTTRRQITQPHLAFSSQSRSPSRAHHPHPDPLHHSRSHHITSSAKEEGDTSLMVAASPPLRHISQQHDHVAGSRRDEEQQQLEEEEERLLAERLQRRRTLRSPLLLADVQEARHPSSSFSHSQQHKMHASDDSHTLAEEGGASYGREGRDASVLSQKEAGEFLGQGGGEREEEEEEGEKHLENEDAYHVALQGEVLAGARDEEAVEEEGGGGVLPADEPGSEIYYSSEKERDDFTGGLHREDEREQQYEEEKKEVEEGEEMVKTRLSENLRALSFEEVKRLEEARKILEREEEVLAIGIEEKKHQQDFERQIDCAEIPDEKQDNEGGEGLAEDEAELPVDDQPEGEQGEEQLSFERQEIPAGDTSPPKLFDTEAYHEAPKLFDTEARHEAPLPSCYAGAVDEFSLNEEEEEEMKNYDTDEHVDSSLDSCVYPRAFSHACCHSSSFPPSLLLRPSCLSDGESEERGECLIVSSPERKEPVDGQECVRRRVNVPLGTIRSKKKKSDKVRESPLPVVFKAKSGEGFAEGRVSHEKSEEDRHCPLRYLRKSAISHSPVSFLRSGFSLFLSCENQSIVHSLLKHKRERDALSSSPTSTPSSPVFSSSPVSLLFANRGPVNREHQARFSSPSFSSLQHTPKTGAEREKNFLGRMNATLSTRNVHKTKEGERSREQEESVHHHSQETEDDRERQESLQVLRDLPDSSLSSAFFAFHTSYLHSMPPPPPPPPPAPPDSSTYRRVPHGAEPAGKLHASAGIPLTSGRPSSPSSRDHSQTVNERESEERNRPRCKEEEEAGGKKRLHKNSSRHHPNTPSGDKSLHYPSSSFAGVSPPAGGGHEEKGRKAFLIKRLPSEDDMIIQLDKTYDFNFSDPPTHPPGRLPPPSPSAASPSPPRSTGNKSVAFLLKPFSMRKEESASPSASPQSSSAPVSPKGSAASRGKETAGGSTDSPHARDDSALPSLFRLKQREGERQKKEEEKNGNSKHNMNQVIASSLGIEKKKRRTKREEGGEERKEVKKNPSSSASSSSSPSSALDDARMSCLISYPMDMVDDGEKGDRSRSSSRSSSLSSSDLLYRADSSKIDVDYAYTPKRPDNDPHHHVYDEDFSSGGASHPPRLRRSVTDSLVVGEVDEFYDSLAYSYGYHHHHHHHYPDPSSFPVHVVKGERGREGEGREEGDRRIYEEEGHRDVRSSYFLTHGDTLSLDLTSACADPSSGVCLSGGSPAYVRGQSEPVVVGGDYDAYGGSGVGRRIGGLRRAGGGMSRKHLRVRFDKEIEELLRKKEQEEEERRQRRLLLLRQPQQHRLHRNHQYPYYPDDMMYHSDEHDLDPLPHHRLPTHRLSSLFRQKRSNESLGSEGDFREAKGRTYYDDEDEDLFRVSSSSSLASGNRGVPMASWHSSPALVFSSSSSSQQPSHQRKAKTSSTTSHATSSSHKNKNSSKGPSPAEAESHRHHTTLHDKRDAASRESGGDPSRLSSSGHRKGGEKHEVESKGEESVSRKKLDRENPSSRQQGSTSSKRSSPMNEKRDGRDQQLPSGGLPTRSTSSPFIRPSASSPPSQTSPPGPLRSFFLSKLHKLNSQKSPHVGISERSDEHHHHLNGKREDEGDHHEDEGEDEDTRSRKERGAQGAGEGKNKGNNTFFSQLRNQLSLSNASKSSSSLRDPTTDRGRRGERGEEEEERMREREKKKIGVGGGLDEAAAQDPSVPRRERGRETRRSQSVPPFVETTAAPTGKKLEGGKKKFQLNPRWPFSTKGGEEESKAGERERGVRMSSSPCDGSDRPHREHERDSAMEKKGRSFNNPRGQEGESGGGKKDVLTWLKLRSASRRE